MSARNQIKKKRARFLRRRRHVRKSVHGTQAKPRLSVFRSHKNISCQVIDDLRGVTLASASTQTKDVKAQLGGAGGNAKAAAVVGKLLAEKVKALGITSLEFDRSGYRFHGRIKALVQAARDAGLRV
jgi:large subunit ribosomal protein L18